MTETNKYSYGKIYKIVCNVTGDVYIGSTCKKTVAERLATHRYSYNAYLKGTYDRYVRSFKILANKDFNICLVEPFPCKNRDELKARERFYIENTVCVNKCVPGRTRQEYRDTHKKETKEYFEKYKEANNEKLHKKYNCQCGGKYIHQNKTQHFKTKLHLNWLQKVQNKIETNLKITENNI